MAEAVVITREDFEQWLDTFSPYRWKIKEDTSGIYWLYLSDRVVVHISSTLRKDNASVEKDGASIQMKLISALHGHTLNKVGQGQQGFNRVKGWRVNLKKGVDRFIDIYRKSPSFYDNIARVPDREKYLRDWSIRVESYPGWERDSFLSDLHAKIMKGNVLSEKQEQAIMKIVGDDPPPVPMFARVRALFIIARAKEDKALMASCVAYGKALSTNAALRPPRDVEDALSDKAKVIKQILDKNPKLLV